LVRLKPPEAHEVPVHVPAAGDESLTLLQLLREPAHPCHLLGYVVGGNVGQGHGFSGISRDSTI